MKEKELMINGVGYQYRQNYLKEDKLWECAYVDVHGNLAEVASGNVVSYDESLGQAKKELEMLIKNNQLEYGVDNELVLLKHYDSETQKKIKREARRLKMELWGEWDTEENRYSKWRRYMHSYCGIWFSKGEFDRT